MKWNIHLVAFLGCALLVQIVLSNAVKQNLEETRPFIATGGQHVQITRCSEAITLYAGDNAAFYCNANVTLICDADGDPVPRISWLFNGESVGEDFEVSGLLMKNDSLLLRNVSLNTGVYTCVASNANGTSNATTVIEYIDPRAPKIHSDFKTEVFTDNFKILPVTVGSNVTAYGKSLLKLICNVSGAPTPDIEWSRERGKIERKYLKGDNVLLPHNVALAGKYICKARNFVGQTQMVSNIQFIVPILPRILPSRNKLTAIHGENQISLKVGDDVTTIAGTEVTILCLASGNPEPVVTWYYNGHVCPHNDMSTYGYGLSFQNRAIQTDESGNYTCVAKNTFGSVSVTSHVDVIDPVMPYINSSAEDVVMYDMSFPTIKQIGGSLKLLVGASFWLTCEVGGIPRPEVQWKKDNLPIHSGKRIKVSERRIKVLGTMMSDTGWYSCTASNGAGTVTSSTFVHLIAPVKPRISHSGYRKRQYVADMMPTPLRISVGVDLRILAYRALVLYCSATGFPPPVFSWQKNGYPMEMNEDVFVSQGGRKLVFPKVVPAQNGLYSCVASNAAGEDRQRTSIISRMPLRPKIEIRKSVLSKYQLSPQRGGSIRVYEIPDGETHLVAGSDVILECIARRGFPRAKFKWFKDGRRITKTTIESFNKSKLKLPNVQKSDEGVYKCFASNVIGQQEKIIEIKLKDRNRYNKSQRRL